MSAPSASERGAALATLLKLNDPPIIGLSATPDDPMRRHTTLRLGGPADLWCVPDDPGALSALLSRANEANVPVSFVGGGTNLLVRDGGIRGVVVNLRRINRVSQPQEESDPMLVAVEAGASTGRVLQFATSRAFGGVEFLAGVPGTVGGGLIMNAGTYLGEFTDVVIEVQSLNLRGEIIRRAHADCGFRYRDSNLPKDELIIGALLRLRPRSLEAIERDVAKLREHRRQREPMGVPNNGSTFKNPEGDYAGRLIEAAGLKGTRRGGAVVSDKHANWLIVDREVQPSCTSRDLIDLIEHVEGEVERAHGVRLRREVKILGED